MAAEEAGPVDAAVPVDEAASAKDAALIDAAGAERWACLGHVTAKPAVKPKPILTLTLREATASTQPVTSNVQVTPCSKLDVECMHPIAAPAGPDAAGAVAFTLDSAFAGFFDVQSTAVPPTYLPMLFFVNPPLVDDRTSLVPMVTPPNFKALVAVASGGASADPSLGNVIFSATDCLGALADGVSATIDGGGMRIDGGLATGTTFYLVNQLPSLNLDVTDASGAGGFLNVTPGIHVISAFRKATGTQIAKISVVIRAGTISYAALPPLP
jgi:hypothetical protein